MALDRLETQMQRERSSSNNENNDDDDDSNNRWVAYHQSLFENAYQTKKNRQRSKDKTNVPTRPTTFPLMLLGMERLAHPYMLKEILTQRQRHRKRVLYTQTHAPFNNANRLQQAIRQISGQESEASQQLAHEMAVWASQSKVEEEEQQLASF